MKILSDDFFKIVITKEYVKSVNKVTVDSCGI